MATTERVTVTMPADLLDGIDRLERNRSRFITEAVQHELIRREHDALLRSLHNPHPDTVDLAEAGLGDWTSDLPGNEGLVDESAGIAVQWVEGKGWVKPSA